MFECIAFTETGWTGTYIRINVIYVTINGSADIAVLVSYSLSLQFDYGSK